MEVDICCEFHVGGFRRWGKVFCLVPVLVEVVVYFACVEVVHLPFQAEPLQEVAWPGFMAGAGLGEF